MTATKTSEDIATTNDVVLNHTIAASAPALEEEEKPRVPVGAHVEARLAIEQGNKEFNVEVQKEKKLMKVAGNQSGAAVGVVDIPSHQREVVLAQSSIPGCAVAAVEAWDAVKGDDDASFANAAALFRNKLLDHAESVYRSGQVLGGDTALARFERKVAEIKGQQDAARAAKEQN